MSDVKLILGDCLEVLPALEAGSVDAVITDPPYGVSYEDWDSDIPPQKLLDECLRIAVGPVLMFGAAPMILDFARYSPRPDRILIWAPAFTLSHTGSHGMSYRYHPIYVWRMETPAVKSVIPWDILSDNTEGHHWWNFGATKPLSLMRKLVVSWGGDTILDPYMGSGTTGVACVETGRNFIGCDNDPIPYAIAERRIAEAQLQMRMPL